MSPAPPRPLTYLSFGAGVQSTALLVMSGLGDYNVPRADVAIFADTGDEPQYVYDAVARYREWAAGYGIPLVTVSVGCLSHDVLSRHNGTRGRFAAIPAHSTNVEGKHVLLKRQCTAEYKIRPIHREVRKRIGRKRSARAVALIGISVDEAGRARDSRDAWITNRYPLLDAGLTREECLVYLHEKGLPLPQKSACIFCPFHDDAYWLRMRAEHPEEFARAVTFDNQIRDMGASGMPRPVYLHRSLKPLGEVEFVAPVDDGQLPLWKAFQADGFGNDCSGMCGV